MDRAVSDVLGYILIFGLIMSSVAVITVAGSNSLDSVRDAERFENAQRVFDVLDENVIDHLDSGVKSRGTEIRLADAGLHFDDPVAFNVSVEGEGYNRSVADPLVYRQSTDRQISFTFGATVRQDRGYARLTNDPPIRIGDRSIVTLVRTRGRDTGISGSGRVLVRTQLATQSVHRYTGAGPYDVNLTITTDHPEAWGRWLEAQTGEPCTVGGGAVTCSFRTDELYVRTVTIDVYFA